jgi:hypothetical protein
MNIIEEKLFPYINIVIQNKHLSKIVISYIDPNDFLSFQIVLKKFDEFYYDFYYDLYLNKCKPSRAYRPLNNTEFKLILTKDNLIAKLSNNNLEHIYKFDKDDYECSFMDDIINEISLEINNLTYVYEIYDRNELDEILSTNSIYQFFRFIDRYRNGQIEIIHNNNKLKLINENYDYYETNIRNIKDFEIEIN